MKIMVTGAGALLGQGIIHALRLSSLHPTIVAVDPNPLAVGLYWADTAIIVPLVKSPDYEAHIREVLCQERPDVVLVGTDVELPFYAARREAWEAEFNTHILVSDPQAVAIADDKWLTVNFLKDNGFLYPESSLPGDEEGLIEQVGFPLVVKPRHGARSVGIHVVNNREELQAAIQAEDNVVIQEYIGSRDTEYTAGTLYFDGRCDATIVMRRELRDGNTYRAWVEDCPHLNQMVRACGEKFQAYGPANFQFRVDDDGCPKVFEINARFSGTTPLRELAGFHEVEMCLRRLLLGEPITQPSVQPMVLLRYWSEIVVKPEEVVKAGV